MHKALVALIAASSLAGWGGCSSSGGSDAATGRDAQSDGHRDHAVGSTDRAVNPDQSTGTDTGAAPLDCLPSCIAEVRATCRVPMMGDGTCTEASAPNGTHLCYSNGVKQIIYAADAGAAHRIMYTKMDGVTPCYFEDEPGTNEIQFFSANGTLLGTLQYNADASGTVTCAATGQPYQLSASSLSGTGSGCDGLTSSDCSAGTCN